MRNVRCMPSEPLPVPTPVIVSPGPERLIPFRSTVISPNPERALYTSVDISCHPEEQPVDFSARSGDYRAENTGYAIGLAIAV